MLRMWRYLWFCQMQMTSRSRHKRTIFQKVVRAGFVWAFGQIPAGTHLLNAGNTHKLAKITASPVFAVSGSLVTSMRVKGIFFIGCTPWVKKVVLGARCQHIEFFEFLQAEISIFQVLPTSFFILMCSSFTFASRNIHGKITNHCIYIEKYKASHMIIR